MGCVGIEQVHIYAHSNALIRCEDLLFCHRIGCPHLAALDVQGMAGRTQVWEQEHAQEATQKPLLNSNHAGIQRDLEDYGSVESSEHEVNEGQGDGTAGVGSAVFNLSTTVVGAGIMALPATVRVLGVPLAVLVMVAMGYISEVSLEVIVRYASKMNARAYDDIVAGISARAPRAARIVTQFCLVVFTVGVLICYLIIIADVLAGSAEHRGLFEQWVGQSGWWNSRALTIFLTLLLVMAPLAALPRLDSLKYTSAVSIGLALLFVFLTVGVTLVKLGMGEVHRPRLVPDFSTSSAWFNIFSVIPIMTNAFICHFNVPPIYLELRYKSRRKMNQVVRFSVIFCTALYILTGVSGYLLFGEATSADILSNFDTNLHVPCSNLINYVIRVGYAVHIMLVFPVIFFSARITAYDLICPNSRPLTESKTGLWLVTVALFSIMYVGSTSIPDIWIAFNFTGATTGMCIAFIFPALAAILARSADPDDKYQRTVSWIILPLAVFSGVTGVVTQIISLA